MPKKYIFITGGVVSSLGKGITAASIGQLLESRGLKIALLKLDPYLNVDPGTMNPFQHGEVYVTDDGAETDLDLGHYYRFTNSPLSRASNTTSGQIYDSVIKKERKGDYLGKTVQVVPHVTDEIKQRILNCSEQASDIEVVLVEIGGTVGDIESLPFLEAIRQFRYERLHDCMNIHLTYIPYLKAAGEIKTKPTQHSVQALREIGIIPDMIICRSAQSFPEDVKEKISLFCSVPKEMVIEEKDVTFSIYEVPIELQEQKIDEKICKHLKIESNKSNLSEWKNMVHRAQTPKRDVVVGIVGKYMDHQDAYKSIFEALSHAAIFHEAKLQMVRFESESIQSFSDLHSSLPCDGFLVPGGFGERGWDGKILTAQYCRTKKIPYFGICLGMQVMIVEFARNVLQLKEAHSTEVFLKTPFPVISLLDEQKNVENLGGSMRLGSYPCNVLENTLAYKAYAKPLVFERHRHRYEFNNTFKTDFEKKGMVFSGLYEKNGLCEISEILNHPWMLGVQFHPEFQSKPLLPHPLFKNFIETLLNHKKDV